MRVFLVDESVADQTDLADLAEMAALSRDPRIPPMTRCACVECSLPYEGAPYVVPNRRVCRIECRGLTVRGTGVRTADDYRSVAGAICGECAAPLGRLVVVFATLFGRIEDERVCAGPWKVY